MRRYTILILSSKIVSMILLPSGVPRAKASARRRVCFAV
jgi:hypothetical protein